MRGIERYGWRRVDPRPWRTKLTARWEHPKGWRLEHCGHPTALWPWALYNPEGAMVCTGVMGPTGNPTFGTAWPTLEIAAAFVDGGAEAARAALEAKWTA